MIQQLADKMQRFGIVPELEAFDAGMINFAKYLINKELLNPPYYFNLLLGNISCEHADLLLAGIVIRDLPDGSICSLAGIVDDQLKMHSVAIAIGGSVRVGLEDNTWYDQRRTKLASNLDLVKRIHLIADAYVRKVMTSEEFRQKMNLEEGCGKYSRTNDYSVT
jgi:3-keto-5-aminohexanoate cleavage enzyme